MSTVQRREAAETVSCTNSTAVLQGRWLGTPKKVPEIESLTTRVRLRRVYIGLDHGRTSIFVGLSRNQVPNHMGSLKKGEH
jgi:hypothetical protein